MGNTALSDDGRTSLALSRRTLINWLSTRAFATLAPQLAYAQASLRRIHQTSGRVLVNGALAHQ